MNTIARYLTVGGATVDINTKLTSRCTGCGESDDEDRAFFGYNTDRRAHRWAQAHAETCRAMPKREAAE